jgi:hypothetical protein
MILLRGAAMTNTRAMATLVVGESYSAIWHQVCEPNWQRYAEKYHLDLVCLSQPLDTSKRAQERSAAWQKCLILSQDFAQRYEQVVWMDADIMINNRTAPSVVEGVPVEKVGAAQEMTLSHTEPKPGRELLDRIGEFWPNVQPVIRYTPREYYTVYGLPDDCDRVINTGVMVLSPSHHRALLEKVYYAYEEKRGREWHMEMRPLSYELNHAGLVHWIDSRFNMMWLPHKFLYYPFLLQPQIGSALSSRVKRKLCKLIGVDPLRTLHTACINAAFQRSYFFHLGGIYMEEISMINQQAGSWSEFLI